MTDQHLTVAFVDTETTGLDPVMHEIWEVGLIVDDVEYLWHLPVDLGRADQVALNIGGYYQRYGDTPSRKITDLHTFARDFSNMTRCRHLVGAVISFDEERLRKLLKRNGACPGWHYHLVDVEALVAGKFGLVPPWDSETLSDHIGINPDNFDRHTAIGDARWAKAIYEAVMS